MFQIFHPFIVVRFIIQSAVIPKHPDLDHQLSRQVIRLPLLGLTALAPHPSSSLQVQSRKFI